MNSEAAQTIRLYLDSHGGTTEATLGHLLTTFGLAADDDSARSHISSALGAAGVQVDPSVEGLAPDDTVLLSRMDVAGATEDAPASPLPKDAAPEAEASTSSAEAVDQQDLRPEESGTSVPAESPPALGPAAHSRGGTFTGSPAMSEEEPSGRPPQRVCRKCSAISETAGEFCPHCGTPYQRKGPVTRSREAGAGWSRRRKALTLGLPLLMLLAAAGAGVYLKVDHDNQVAADRKAKIEEGEKAERERQRQDAEEAEQEKAERELQKTLREASVSQLQTAITKDARKAVAEGVLEGPILRTECTPKAGEDPTASDVGSVSYECIAVNEESGGQIKGPGFSGSVDVDSGDIRWKLGG